MALYGTVPPFWDPEIPIDLLDLLVDSKFIVLIIVYSMLDIPQSPKSYPLVI